MVVRERGARGELAQARALVRIQVFTGSVRAVQCDGVQPPADDDWNRVDRLANAGRHVGARPAEIREVTGLQFGTHSYDEMVVRIQQRGVRSIPSDRVTAH